MYTYISVTDLGGILWVPWNPPFFVRGLNSFSMKNVATPTHVVAILIVACLYTAVVYNRGPYAKYLQAFTGYKPLPTSLSIVG